MASATIFARRVFASSGFLLAAVFLSGAFYAPLAYAVVPSLPSECPGVIGDYNVIAAAGATTNGTAGNDFIYAGDGNTSEIKGKDGNDCILVGDNNTEDVKGEDGNDVIVVGGGNAGKIDGGKNDDTIVVGDGNTDEVKGGDDEDDITVGDTNSGKVKGDKGDDTIDVGDGNTNDIEGGDGEDDITVGDNNTGDVKGGKHDDNIDVGENNSGQVDGGDGEDIVTIGNNNTGEIKGGKDDDDLSTLDGDFTLDGGDDTDVCEHGTGAIVVINCETINIVTTTTSTGSTTAGNSGVNGKRRRDQNLIRFLTGQANIGFGQNNVPSDSFGGPGPGGGTGELTDEQHTVLCSVRDQISLLAASYYVGLLANNYAHVWDVPEATIMDVLENGTGCDAINAAQAEQKRLEAEAAVQAEADKVAAIDAAIKAERAAFQGAPVEFAVADDGYPVSSDPIWNVCIRNMQVFIAGQDKPVNCNKYHEAHTWTHPDTLVSFKWMDRIVKRIDVQGKIVAINPVETPAYIAQKNMQLAKTDVLYTFAETSTTKAQQVVASLKKITTQILAFLHN